MNGSTKWIIGVLATLALGAAVKGAVVAYSSVVAIEARLTSHEASQAGSVRLLRLICRNTARDVVTRVECDR